MFVKKLETKDISFGIKKHSFEAAHMGITEFNPGDVFPAHRHDLCEIHYIKKGELKIRISKKHYNAFQNQLFYIKSGDPHYQRCTKKTTVYYMVLNIFENKGTGRRNSPPVVKRTQWEAVSKLGKYPSCSLEATPSVKKHLVYIYESLAEREKLNTRRLNKSFGLFILELGSLLNEKINKAPGRKNIDMDVSDKRKSDAVINALKFLKKNSSGDADMNKVAAGAFYSLRHFERVFKNTVGISPKEYLLEQRILKASELLRKTRLKIDEIIIRSGFRNRQHFFKYFARRFGVSPDSYRKNLRKQ